jgi:hypothetical protein
MIASIGDSSMDIRRILLLLLLPAVPVPVPVPDDVYVHPTLGQLLKYGFRWVIIDNESNVLHWETLMCPFKKFV